MIRLLIAVLLAWTLAACAGSAVEDRAGEIRDNIALPAASPLTKLADEIAPVPDELRPLRACLVTAAVGIVATEKARYGLLDPDVVAGHLQSVRQIISEAATGNPLWRNAALARAEVRGGALIIATAKSKILNAAEKGLTPDLAITVAKSGAISVVMDPAVARDVRTILAKVAAGELGELDGYKACESSLVDSMKRLSG